MLLTTKKSEIWQAPFIAKLAAEFHERTLQLKQTAPESLYHRLTHEFNTLKNQSDYESQLRAFLTGIQLLKVNAEQSISKLSFFKHYQQLETILVQQKINPLKSKLNFLWFQLYEIAAEYFFKLQQPVLGQWYLFVADELKKTHTVKLSIRVDEKAQSLAPIPSVQALRLSGNVLEALASIDGKLETTTSPLEKNELRIERYFTEWQLKGNRPFMLDLEKACGGNLPNSFYLKLYLRCVASRHINFKDLKYIESKIQKEDIWKFISTLMKIKKLEDNQISDFGFKACSFLSIQEGLERETLLLTVAVMTRQLARLKPRDRYFVFFLKLYRSLFDESLLGLCGDPLNLLDDLWLAEDDQTGSSLGGPGESAVPTGIKRWLGISHLSYDLIKILGKNRFQNFFSASKLSLDEATKQKIAQAIVYHFKHLKGPLAKVGQTASYLGPSAFVFFKELKALQKDIQSMSYAQVYESLSKEMKLPVNQVFIHIDKLPIGVGSIGQVHRAQLVNGDWVAVKVQHENIVECIKTDLFFIKVLVPLLKVFYQRFDFKRLLRELEAKLNEECDYLHEAKNQNEFRAKFKDDAQIIVPKVYSELCTKKVLVTEYIDGMNFYDFLQTQDEQGRREAARAICRFVVSSCRDGFFNSDPHPGNYVFVGNKVAVLDFGNTKQWEESERVAWSNVIMSAFERDEQLLRNAMEDMGCIINKKRFVYGRLYNQYFNHSMGNVSVDAETKFEFHTIHDEFSDMLSFKNDNIRHMNINAPYLFGFRVYQGLICVLASLDVTHNWRKEMIDIMRFKPSANNPAPAQ